MYIRAASTIVRSRTKCPTRPRTSRAARTETDVSRNRWRRRRRRDKGGGAAGGAGMSVAGSDIRCLGAPRYYKEEPGAFANGKGTACRALFVRRKGCGSGTVTVAGDVEVGLVPSRCKWT